MTFQGSHMLFYIFGVIGAIYVWWVLYHLVCAAVTEDPSELSQRVRKNKKIHIALALIGALLITLKPFKLETQSDNARTQARHSFDTSVYVSDRKVIDVVTPSYELSEIREEKDKSRAEWDSIRGENK